MVPTARAVVDLNVFVSAVLGSTSCRAVVAAIASGVIIPIVSPRFLTELRGVLRRPKFHPHVTPAAIEELSRFLERHAFVVTPSRHLQVTRDPDDDHLLSLAIEGMADVIVSGDNDVISLGSFARIPIRTPSEFLRWLSRHP